MKKRASVFAMAGRERDKSTPETMTEDLATFTASVRALSMANKRLGRTKNQCMMHIHQYAQEYEALKKIYAELKRSLEPEMHDMSEHDMTLDDDDESAAPPSGKEKRVGQNVEKEMEVKSIEYIIIALNGWPKEHVSLRFAFSTSSVLCTIEFDPTGTIVAFSDGEALRGLSIADRSIVFSMQIPRNPRVNEMHTRVVRFSHDGHIIALSSMVTAVSLFSVNGRMYLGSLEGHEKAVTSLLFMNQSSRLISGGLDGRICIWNVAAMTLIQSVTVARDGMSRAADRAIVSMTMSHDECYVLCGFMNGDVGVYNCLFAQHMMTFSAHPTSMISVVPAQRKHTFVTTAHDMTAKLWKIRGTASRMRSFNGHTDYVVTATVAKHFPLLITGAKDESIRGWNINTGEPVFKIELHTNTIFQIRHHPTDNAFVSCSGDGYICVWDYSWPAKM